MAGQTVIVGDHRVNDLFHVADVDVGIPDFAPSTTDRHEGGVHVDGMRVGTATIAMRLVVLPAWDVREAVSMLLSWLDTPSPLWLEISRDGGRRRRVVASGAPVIEDTEYEDVITLELLQVDPYLYGQTRTATVAPNYDTTVVVGGDAPTRPSIVAGTAVRRTSDDLWGVRMDSSTSALVKIPSSTQTRVTIDCEARTAQVGNDSTTITLESDWLELTPGSHTLTVIAGTGSATVTWVERWHR